MNNNIFNKVKTSVDRVIERINTKLENDDIQYLVEIQSNKIKNKEYYKLFLVVKSGDLLQVLLDIPLVSSKLEHKAEAYLQMLTILVDLGLQSLTIMTQEAIKKQKEKELTEDKKNEIITKE